MSVRPLQAIDSFSPILPKPARLNMHRAGQIAEKVPAIDPAHPSSLPELSKPANASGKALTAPDPVAKLKHFSVQLRTERPPNPDLPEQRRAQRAGGVMLSA